MLPQVKASQNGTTPRESFKEDAQQLLGLWDEDEFRDNEFLRAYMIPVIAELGTLVQKHAARMAADSGQDCAFQLDRFADVICWCIAEYVCQSGIEGETREGNINPFQITERHAQSWFDWPAGP